ncbi:MAG TPA: histidine kinase [Frankiaceae bacterium]|nr:histidine kinase [Frankiaceae bacterium]
MDTATTVLLAVLTVPSLLHRDDAAPWAAWLFSFGLLLPLALRRRAPSAVFSILALIALTQWAVGVRIGTDFALLVALYTVAAHQSRRRALIAAGVCEVGVVLASIRFAPAGEDVLASLVFLSGLVAAALSIGITMRTRRAYLASVLDRAVRLERERDQQARLAATAERTRIARELHDIIAHNLSVMVALADGAAIANAREPEQASGAMQQVSATGRQALSEMQRLLGVLREDAEPSDRAPQPDLSQLDELLAQTRKAGIPVRLTVQGTPVCLPPTQEAAIYRIIQEALTNVLKHAVGASDVAVLLRWTARALFLEIADDGEATIAVRDRISAGHGLSGMTERISLFGGKMSAGPHSGRGWSVRAELPLDEAAEHR